MRLTSKRERTPPTTKARTTRASTVAMDAPSRPSCPCGGHCPRCQVARVSHPGDGYERAARQQAKTLMAQTPPRVAADAGASVPGALQAFFAPRIGIDLSTVRIHRDADAARRAAQLNANAFTDGSDIYFAHNRYRPDRPDGLHLLAHELTHVAQQQRDPAARMLQRDGETILPQPNLCDGRRDITAEFRQFVTDIPGLINAATGLSDAQRQQLRGMADLVFHDEGAAQIESFSVVVCDQINSSLAIGGESIRAYVDPNAREIGMTESVRVLMDNFRSTHDRETLVSFMQTIAHEKRHVTLGGAMNVDASAVLPGRSSAAADMASYRAEEILTVAEEIAVAAMAMREDYEVPSDATFRIFRNRNMIRGWVTDAEFQRLRTLIIQQLRDRYGFDGGCDNTMVVGVVTAMERGEWYDCDMGSVRLVRAIPEGLSVCETDGEHDLCRLRRTARARRRSGS